MNRRQFLHTAAASAVWAVGAPRLLATDPVENSVRPPRWRGFNLLEKFTASRNAPFRESDFEWMAEWGFNFARLPMSYRCWVEKEDWRKLQEPALREIAQAVEFGRKHGIHVCLNFHRAPGYCVNPPPEPRDLWTDSEALDVCAFHWAAFAKRFKGIPSQQLSFNLLNEPKDLPAETYSRVVRHLVEAIRAEDPQRLIIADGLRWGTQPVPELIGLGVQQSTRGYQPIQLSHYRASWMRGSDTWAEPTWPLKLNEQDVWDKSRLHREAIDPWQKLEQRGVRVHVGEWGAYHRTPHRVVLAWMRDCLELWREAGWGWALWNLRGEFGVLDSRRADVAYENFRGHQLDRQMLDLLRAY